MAAEHHEPDPFHHVQDSGTEWGFFDVLTGKFDWEPLFQIGPLKFPTKYMLLELIAAGLILAIYIPLARRARDGSLPRGAWWNAFESLLTFIRNEVARPNLGAKDADRYLPFLWTLFLFILFNNLLGMIPFMGSPTASIWVTGALALCSFAMLHGAASVQMGPLRYLASLWPHIDVPYVGWLFSGMIFVLELLGTVIKSSVLAVRLFANMFAGHIVLAIILMFIYQVGKGGFTWLWPMVTMFSVLGVVALSFLEIFVAFLHAYIFVFLTALFMGMALHPEH